MLNTSFLPSSLGVNTFGIYIVNPSSTTIIVVAVDTHGPDDTVNVTVYVPVVNVWLGFVAGEVLLPSPKSQL